MYYYITSNNQRLRSAGDNDRMPNGRFRVTDTIVKTRVIGLRVIDYVQTRVIKLRSVHSINSSWKSR